MNQITKGPKGPYKGPKVTWRYNTKVPRRTCDYSYAYPHMWNLHNDCVRADGYVASGDSPSSYLLTTFRNGVENPYWKRTIREGGNASSPLTLSKMSIKDSPGDFTRAYGSGYGATVAHYTGTCLTASPVSCDPAVLAAADEQARTEFFQKLGKATRQTQGLVFLAEIRETVKMIRNPLSAFRTGVVQHAQKAAHEARRLSKQPFDISRTNRLDTALNVWSELWLQTSFGLRPLISDLQGAVEAWRIATGVKPPRERIKAFASNAQTTCFAPQTGLVWDALGGNCTYSYEIQDTHEATVRYVAGLRLDDVYDRSQGTYLSALTQQLGLTWSEFVPTAWEVLPWSFLIDYFLNVGEILNASSLKQNLVYCTKSSIQKTTRIIKGDLSPYQTGTKTGTVGSSTATMFEYLRVVQGGVGIPPLKFGIDLSPVRLGNLLALRRSVSRDLRVFLR